MSIVWTLLIGFVVGLIARLFAPGPTTLRGVLLTTLLGMSGAFVATFLGQFVGIYAPGEQTGFVGSIVGAVITLFIWSWFFGRKAGERH